MANLISYRAGSLEQPNLEWSRVADTGVQGIELNWSTDVTAAAIAAALTPHGLRLTSLGLGCPLDDDDLPAQFGQAAAVAAELGAHYLFTSTRGDDMTLEAAAGKLQRLGDATGPHKVSIALETHPDLCTNAQTMKQTMAAVNHPWVGVNYDTANVYYYNHEIDTVDQVAACTDFIRGVHFKDGHGKYHDFDFPVFGEGIVPFDTVHAILQQAGYTDAYCMELEGPAFNRDAPDDLANKIARCVQHLRTVGVLS